jgi:hypothetical protein
MPSRSIGLIIAAAILMTSCVSQLNIHMVNVELSVCLVDAESGLAVPEVAIWWADISLDDRAPSEMRITKIGDTDATGCINESFRYTWERLVKVMPFAQSRAGLVEIQARMDNKVIFRKTVDLDDYYTGSGNLWRIDLGTVEIDEK